MEWLSLETDGCRIIQMYLMLPTVHLKMTKWVHFVLCLFYSSGGDKKESALTFSLDGAHTGSHPAREHSSCHLPVSMAHLTSQTTAPGELGGRVEEHPTLPTEGLQPKAGAETSGKAGTHVLISKSSLSWVTKGLSSLRIGRKVWGCLQSYPGKGMFTPSERF